MAVDVSRHDEVVNKLERRYEGTILRGDELLQAGRIPTGSLELDYITGGGIPLGRWSRLYGGYSSGKTRTAYSVIAEAQKAGLACVYYDVEKQYDSATAQRAGVDTPLLTVMEGSTIEEVGEKLEASLGIAHLHVIDSCSNAVSVDELAMDLTEWRPGLMARAWGKALRRAHERFDRTDNAVVLIDQLRSDFGGRGKGSEIPPGGKFLNFLSSMNLSFRRGKWLFYDKHGNLSEKGDPGKTLSGQKEPDGREILVRCEKSRIGRPEMTATLHFDTRAYAFDTDFEYVTSMQALGVVTRKSEKTSWWELSHNGHKPLKGQGEQGIRDMLSEVPELRDEVRTLMLESET